MDKMTDSRAAEAQPNWKEAPPGATHYQPSQDAYYKRVSASEWYVWGRMEPRELLRWLPSPGTSDSAEWVVPPAEAQAQPVAWVRWHAEHGFRWRPIEQKARSPDMQGYVSVPLYTAPPSAPVGVVALANHFDSVRNGLPDEWQDFAAEFSRDLRALAQQPAVEYERQQPCGCVLCVCEDEKRCHGCGAKHCGNRTGHPAYVTQQPAAVDEALPDFLDRIADELVSRDTRAGTFAPGIAESLRGRAIVLRTLAAQPGGSDNG